MPPPRHVAVISEAVSWQKRETMPITYTFSEHICVLSAETLKMIGTL